MSTTRDRVDNDFYATPFNATKAILDKVTLHGSILEPAAGQGHISKVIKEYYPNCEIISTDLIKRQDKFGQERTNSVVIFLLWCFLSY